MDAAEIEIIYEKCSNGSEISLSEARKALDLFVQLNFTGPVHAELKSDFEQLAIDGEPAHHLVSGASLLVAAQDAFERLSEPIWQARALAIHQGVLQNPAESLRKKIFELYSEANIEHFAKENDLPLPELYLEIARAYTIYDNMENAATWSARATAASGLVWQITGVRGKRTKFQEHEVSQLVCLAVSRQPDAVTEPSTETTGPKSLELGSDLLLEKLDLRSVDETEKSDLPEALAAAALNPNKPSQLNNLDNAILLLQADIVGRSSSLEDAVSAENRLAIAARVIENPPQTVNWSLFSRSLWLRSILETKGFKTVERGVLQMQSLVEELGYAQTKFLTSGGSGKEEKEEADAATRLRFIHLLTPLPRWGMDIKLAEAYASLGVIKSATEIYERLGMLPDAALLLAVTGEEEQGLEMLDKYLESHPTDARAWSIKGDITLDPQFWEKSWEVGRYAPSKRSLGRYYFAPPQNGKVSTNLGLAKQHLTDSLEVNGLNTDAWFVLGCVGLADGKFDEAAAAFKQYVSLDPENNKGWSNLGTSLLRMGKPEQALHALQQAVRTERNSEPNWRIWSNLVTVAAELGDWYTVLSGIRRILYLRSDLQDKFINSSVLYEVVKVFTSEQYVQSAQQDQMIDLFTVDLPKVITTDPGLYKLISLVDEWRGMPWEALSDLEKAFRICTHMPDIETNEKTWKTAVSTCKDLVHAYERLGDREGRIEGSKISPDWKFKARSSIRSLMSKGKLGWEDSAEYEALSELKETLVGR